MGGLTGETARRQQAAREVGHSSQEITLPYEYFDHTADVGIAASGASLEEVFAAAGEGLATLLCAPETVEEPEERELAASAPDLEALLVEWLSEINYRFEVDGFAFRTFRVVEVGETAVRGFGRGESLDLSRHRVGEGVKAVTYHGLEVRQDAEGWQVRVILDI